ncbi:MAG: 4-(cytidine 5'-diphospho)-2-C-methyl-D-erythritol kinase [Lachnospiraceae bacterium]
MDEFRTRAYGKINLGLDVIRKREDGYHEVRMIMQTVQLYDQLILRKTKEDSISVSTNLPFLPNDENNLVYKAIALMKKTYRIQEGVSVELKKFIPVSAGMAGGSSDCAATLHAMNQLFDLKLSRTRLMKLGVALGADVPYCLMRGTALAEGIGEKLSRLDPMPDCYILIAKPGVNVSTKFVYDHLKLDETLRHPDISGMIEAIKEQDLQGISDRLGNVLESVTIPEYPVIQSLKERMLELGAINSLMSGSGPTVFGLFHKEELARNACRIMRQEQIGKQIYLVKPFNIMTIK